MRTSRIKLNEQVAVYHCVTRIVAGQMLIHDQAKEYLRKQIWLTADFCGVQLLTYCIMSNHIHFLLLVPEAKELDDEELVRRCYLIYNKRKVQEIQSCLEVGGKDAEHEREKLLKRMGDVSSFMKEIKQRFSIWYNRKHRRFGAMWAERFKSVLVENQPAALMTMAAYIDLNPVRAELCRDPKDYRFCGYSEAIEGEDHARIGLMKIAGVSDWPSAYQAYRTAIFGEGDYTEDLNDNGTINVETIEQKLKEGKELPQATLLRCRVRYFTDGAIFGSHKFVQEYVEQNRDRFGKKRKKYSSPLKGCDWNGLRVLRDLRKEVFGKGETDWYEKSEVSNPSEN